MWITYIKIDNLIFSHVDNLFIFKESYTQHTQKGFT